MSLLQYFKKAKVLPTAVDTGIGDTATAEANKCVAEVLEQQQERSSRKRKPATAHSEEARAKIGQMMWQKIPLAALQIKTEDRTGPIALHLCTSCIIILLLIIIIITQYLKSA